MNTDPDDCCEATPTEDLRLPTQNECGVGDCTPSESRLQDMINKRFPKFEENPSTNKDTGFRRGVPGQD